MINQKNPPIRINDDICVELLYNGYWQLFRVDSVVVKTKTTWQDAFIFTNTFFGRVLVLDNIIQTTYKDEKAYHEMMVHPVMASYKDSSYKDPSHVLIIGGGDGGIARELLRYPNVQVDMVEIDKSVVDLCTTYMPEISQGAFENPRLHLYIEDGYQYIINTQKKYEVIIVDSTDPVGPGEILFSDTFYKACAEHLMPHGALISQQGVPFFAPDQLKMVSSRIGKIFPFNGFYTTVVPTYVGGFMTLGYSAVQKPIFHPTYAHELYTNVLKEKTNYYHPEMLPGLFILPEFIRRIIQKEN